MSRAHERQTDNLDPPVQRALDELRGTIAQRYPDATFSISRGHDDPHNVHLVATVDIDDPDEVLDLVGERLEQLQVDEGIPVHVIPLRSPAYVLAALQQERRKEPSPRRVPLFGELPLLRR